jgi:hypothetical protein
MADLFVSYSRRDAEFVVEHTVVGANLNGG